MTEKKESILKIMKMGLYVRKVFTKIILRKGYGKSTVPKVSFTDYIHTRQVILMVLIRNIMPAGKYVKKGFTKMMRKMVLGSIMMLQVS